MNHVLALPTPRPAAGIVAHWLNAWRRWSTQRRARRQLLDMDDDRLRDIGLTRYDLRGLRDPLADWS